MRSGDLSTRSRASLGGVRNSVLPLVAVSRSSVLILKPMRAGGHDDLVALLFGEAVLVEDAALVLGTIARLALAALLGALFMDELVARQIGEVVERADVGLAQCDQHLLGQMRQLGERIVDAQFAALLARRRLAPLERLAGAAL